MSESSASPRSDARPLGDPTERSVAQRYVSALQEASLALAHKTELTETVSVLLTHTADALRLEHAFLYLLDEDGATMQAVSTRGLFDRIQGVRCEPKMGMVGRIWASGDPILVNDYEAWTGKGIDIQAEGARSLLVLPIKIRETVVGVVGFATSDPERSLSGDLLQWVSGFVELFSIVLLTARHQDAARVASEARARAEANRRDDRRDEQSVLDALPALVWVKDRDNRILRVNRYAADFLGLPVESIENQYLWELDPERAGLDYRDDLEVLDSGTSRRGQLSPYEDVEGRERWMRVDKMPYHGPEGDLEGLVVFGVDVTEQHLDHARTEASRVAAEQANRVKSKYLATMSREVRAGMNDILAETSQLLDSQLDADQRRHTESIHQDVDSLLGVINDVMDFTRIEAGNLDVEVGDFDLRNLLEDVLDVLSQAAHRNGVELASYVQPSVPQIVAGDSSRMRQVMVNLVATAIRFAESGEVLASVRPVATHDDGWELRFEVRSAQADLSETDVHELFDPYVVVDEEDSGATRSGLGLAISQRLAELMGGKLGVELGADGGTFWCTLPFARPLGTRSPNDSEPLPTPGARILVAEPNPTLSQILRRQLSEIGMQVDLAADARSAEDMVRRARRDDWPYAVAFLSRDLPGDSALSLSRKLKDTPDLTNMLLLLLTPMGQPLSPAVLDRAGIDGVLTKPLHHHRVREYLTAYLGSTSVESTRDEEYFSQLVEGAMPEETGAKGRVLLVDDNGTDQRVTRLALQRLGYGVDLASDAEEALARLTESSYSAVLMDCHMPDMDGFEAAARIRRAEGADGHTPIIAMAVDGSARIWEECLAAGMDDCVSKPVRPRQLQEVLGNWAGATAQAG